MKTGRVRLISFFMDPPYNHLWEKEVLTYLAHSSLADEHTMIITEASKKETRCGSPFRTGIPSRKERYIRRINICLSESLNTKEEKKKMKTAIYPGGFDPVTLGHFDIIKRSSKFF